ncbi:MAG: hypothetical protein ACUZ77_03140 [Candidatus Brocadiales bacterium]
MKEIAEINGKINHIIHEIIELKKTMIPLRIEDKEKTNQAWTDLMAATEDITNLWGGKSAVEEIQDQRDKGK